MTLDDALARIAQLEAGAADRQAEIEAGVAERADLVTAHAAALDSREKEKAAALADAEAKRVADVAKAGEDAAGVAATTIATLTARVADLTARLAGSAGAYRITVTALHAAALAVETDDPAGWIADRGHELLAALARTHKAKILAGAIAAYQQAPADQRAAVLAAVGLGSLAAVPLESQLPLLAKLGPVFDEVDPAVLNQVIGALAQ